VCQEAPVPQQRHQHFQNAAATVSSTPSPNAYDAAAASFVFSSIAGLDEEIDGDLEEL
jgi:hypothetical protein